MTQEQIRLLEKELWDAADELRANSKLTAAEYKDPVLGLVLLRFAQNRYEEAIPIVDAKIPITPRGKRAPNKEDFLGAGAIMLPEKAQYDYLANLPEDQDIAAAINNAMQLIETEYTDLAGNLPKNYQEFERDLLRSLVRVFNNDAVKTATGDVFGRIYEYFLMKFSMQGAGAQEGGEFFTPPSLVQLIVNFIEPDHGTIHDPACGSGGMFVQTGYFVKNHSNQQVNEAIKCYGTEQKTNNTKLAKINLAIHGIEGKIIESNSFYSDPHNLVGECDFVMANPPFNVNKIDMAKDFVKTDKRLPFGVPKVDNGNYLWMQYFYAYLREKSGRAGFVMASSATDAGHTEKLIRQQLIETGAVDCIVSVSNNFFYTRSLPCHLWFYDKGKKTENQDKVLMIDARNVFRKVTTTINDFSDGQMFNLTAIMQFYRQDPNAYKTAFDKHQNAITELLNKHLAHFSIWITETTDAATQLELTLKDSLTIAFKTPSDYAEAQSLFDAFNDKIALVTPFLEQFRAEVAVLEKAIAAKTGDEKGQKKQLSALRSKITALNKPIDKLNKATNENAAHIKQAIKDWQQLTAWFPDEKYQDTEGVCKIVNRAEIIENDYSLTPGRYVGVVAQLDEDFDYKGRLLEIQTELDVLNVEATALAHRIAHNLKTLI
jgi:type I restriction enzyme M protein